ncbi:uncharacterized protein LOC129411614 [Boleophthalmus pectinirostris]|uniref:uncharacterized protein LOC129411614 n=1 Tax=Boleophthalmus pectinirostris TaxID=150288 RepID=UPI002430405B|nr:uncharacterized protein LOC129411614 [Boleophthalmus pectinirostris]
MDAYFEEDNSDSVTTSESQGFSVGSGDGVLEFNDYALNEEHLRSLTVSTVEPPASATPQNETIASSQPVVKQPHNLQPQNTRHHQRPMQLSRDVVEETWKCMSLEDRVRLEPKLRRGLGLDRASCVEEQETNRQPGHKQTTPSQSAQMEVESSSSVMEAPTALSLFKDQQWKSVQREIKIDNPTVINAVLEDRFNSLSRLELARYYSQAELMKRILVRRNVRSESQSNK